MIKSSPFRQKFIVELPEFFRRAALHLVGHVGLSDVVRVEIVTRPDIDVL